MPPGKSYPLPAKKIPRQLNSCLSKPSKINLVLCESRPNVCQIVRVWIDIHFRRHGSIHKKVGSQTNPKQFSIPEYGNEWIKGTSKETNTHKKKRTNANMAFFPGFRRYKIDIGVKITSIIYCYDGCNLFWIHVYMTKLDEVTAQHPPLMIDYWAW